MMWAIPTRLSDKDLKRELLYVVSGGPMHVAAFCKLRFKSTSGSPFGGSSPVCRRNVAAVTQFQPVQTRIP